MSIKFGDHSSDTGVALENGMYDAKIKSASLVIENGEPKTNTNGKKQVDVFFEIDPETSIKRRYAIGFGQNTANKQWAAFAKMIEAATGVKCGDPAQREVTDNELIGRPVRIVVEMNDRGYADVQSVMPPPKSNGTTQRAKPVPIAAGSAESESEQFDEIPF